MASINLSLASLGRPTVALFLIAELREVYRKLTKWSTKIIAFP